MNYALGVLASTMILCNLSADEVKKIEAESVLTNQDALVFDGHVKDKWNLWSKDIDADKKWSEGKVIQSPPVLADCAPEENLPVLKFRIPLEEGKYDIFGKVTRTVGLSTDGGKTFKRFSGGEIAKNASGDCEFQMAGCFADKNPGSAYIDYFTVEKIDSSLITNGKFELGKVGEIPTSWVFWKREKDVPSNAVIVEDAKNGKFACRITSQSEKDWSFVAKSMNVKGGESFEIKVMAKSNNDLNPMVQLQISAFKDGKTFIYGSVPLKNLTKDYQEYSGKITLPMDVSQVVFRIIGEKPCDITVDDFTAELLEAPLQVKAEAVLLNRELLDTSKQWKLEPTEVGSKKKSADELSLKSKKSADSTIPNSAEILKFRIALDKAGSYDVHSTTDSIFAISTDEGKSWTKNFPNTPIIMGYNAKEPVINFWISSHLGNDQNSDGVSLENFVVLQAQYPEAPIFRKVNGFAKDKVVEKFNRALTAFKTNDGVYLSWRALQTDTPNTSFDIYGVVDDKELKLNTTPILDTTDFLLATPTKAEKFILKSGDKVLASANLIESSSDIAPHKTYKLNSPTARLDKVAIGDLTGDGNYDFVVRHSTGNVDPWYKFWHKSPDTFKLEGVSSEGKSLWTKDLGWSIERGIWYSPYIVYDFDGDGKAEVALKLGEGDPRDADGKVTSGNEFLVILNGETGEEIARTPWIERTGFDVGENNYNFASRNQLAVAYLDGKTPSIIMLRGTYTVMKVEAWQLNDGKLEQLWKYNSKPFGPDYQGQGSHSTRVADIDNDGRDEIILGNAVLDDDGSPLWSAKYGHPDYLYISDFLPENSGLEVITIVEPPTRNGGGINMLDARTGKVLWQLKKAAQHMHFGFAGDVDPNYRSAEVGGTDVIDHKPVEESYLYTVDGKLLATNRDNPFFGDAPRFVYWDADLQKEIAKNIVRNANGGDLSRFDGSFMIVADILGDWREEILASGKGEFYVYQTDIPAMDKRTTLMQDHNYRMAIAASSMGYYYDPMSEVQFANVSPNLNLAIRDGKVFATITAPHGKEIKGTFEFLLPDAKVESFNLKGDEVKEFFLSIDIATTPVIQALVKLEDGKVLKNQIKTALPKRAKLMSKPKGIILEAENFTGETGGKVQVRDDKTGVLGKSISHWDGKGHSLSWKVNIPESGNYRLILRYSSQSPTSREILINNKSIDSFEIPSTVGNGSSASDWDNLILSYAFEKGENTITLTNDKGAMLNLDYINLQKF